jgi:hypothetical protein
MILKFKDQYQRPQYVLEISTNSVLCFLWKHLVWLLGLVCMVLAHIIPELPHGWQYWGLLVESVLISAIGYIKANPQPMMELPPVGAPVLPVNTLPVEVPRV